jgi:hypothetical protein
MDTVFSSDRTALIADSKTLGGQMLKADRVDEENSLRQNVERSPAWDAYDVWRRYIKEARDRREGKTEPH